MLCLTASVLSSGLRRGSDKGQPATAVDREWQTLCKRAEVEAVTLAGPAAVPGVLQNTTWYGGARTHARCIALGVLVSSGYLDKTLLGNKTSPQSIFMEHEDSWLLLIIGQTFCEIRALIHIRSDGL